MEDPVEYRLYLHLPYLQDLILYLSSKPSRFGASWPVSLGQVGQLMEGPPIPSTESRRRGSPGDVVPLVPDFVNNPRMLGKRAWYYYH
jgi:hypothetical protein